MYPNDCKWAGAAMQAGVRPDAVYLSFPDPGGRGRFALTGRRRIIRMRPATDSPPARGGPGKAAKMRSVRHAVRRLVFAWLVVGLTASAAAAGPLLPCGVADPGGRTGFVANAHGGIDAVDLATGDLLWDVDGAKRPALAVDDRLYAWAPVDGNGLRVVAFDRAQGGRRLLESEPVTFPDWVSVEQAPGRSFTTRWRLDRGRLILDWEAQAWYSGPHATPQAEADARRRAEGQVRIDVATGKVETAAAEKPAAAPPPPKDLEKAVVRWQGATGGGGAALVLEEADGRQKLSLWLWDAGKVSPPRELLTGKRLLALPTVDERLLCLRDASPSPDEGAGPGDRGRYGWSLFFADSGERLAQAPYDAGTEGVAVVGQRAFFLVAGSFKGPIDRPFVRPRGLKAFDLRTGKMLWERPVEGKLCSPPAP